MYSKQLTARRNDALRRRYEMMKNDKKNPSKTRLSSWTIMNNIKLNRKHLIYVYKIEHKKRMQWSRKRCKINLIIVARDYNNTMVVHYTLILFYRIIGKNLVCIHFSYIFLKA